MIKLPEGSVLAAVSGGADSVAMLRMIYEEKREVTVAHYNHGLRDSADEDEAFVKSLCEKWYVPFVAGRGDVAGEAKRCKRGIEETARKMRYTFLKHARAAGQLDMVATAHTADDNTETVLLNVTRGSGLSGLCGIPYKQGHIIRPLLHVSRAKLLQYLEERDIPYREDESNNDIMFRRNYIRHRVVPALKEVNPALTEAVTRLTELIYEDETHLSGLARAEIEQYGVEYPAKRLMQLPRPIAARVCRLLVQAVGDTPPERGGVKAMLDIAAGGNGRRRHLAGGLTVKKEKGNVSIMKECIQ